MNTGKNRTKIVYVVVGRPANSMSIRMKKLLSLRNSYEKMVLVSVGRNQGNDDSIEVSPIPNPTGILWRIGLKKFMRALNRYLFFPSKDILYVGRMQKELAKCIEEDLKKKKQTCLITSVPPHCICLVGLKLKHKFPELYWIVDWRDLWSYDENYLERSPPIYKDKLLKLENRVLNESDMNVTTNPFARDVLINNYHISPKNVISINQSFCREDFPESTQDSGVVSTTLGDREIKIGFLGTLFKPPKVPGDKVLDAVQYVRNRGIQIKLHHYGTIPPSFEDLAAHKDGAIVFHGFLDHKDSLKEISACDFLLLVLEDLPNSKAIMHIKLPDYLLVNRPIIAIVPDPSAIAEVIKTTHSGFVIPANQDWGEGLERLLSDLIHGAEIPKRKEGEIEEYGWRKVSRQWLNLIDKES